MSPHDTRRNRDQGQTRPSQPHAGDTRPMGTGAERPPSKGQGMPWLLLVGLLGAAVLILGAAGASGYIVGMQERQTERATQEASLLQEQFDRGVLDLEEGRLRVAKQRFEYILEVDPDYPGVRDLLTLAQQGLNEPTVTPSPTPTEIILTPTPTLSLNTLEGRLEAGRGALSREQWTEAIEILLDLRRTDADYRFDEVNADLFTAYRNRGLSKIFRKELAGGIYDLMVASRVGTLDNQAQSWMRTASFYRYANSFIGLDWVEATRNFSDLCSSGVWDSCFKYAKSAKEYADLLIDDEEYCSAHEYYRLSLDTREDSGLEPTADRAEELCLTATVTPPTATPTATVFTATPGPGTVSPTIGPSDTPSGATATPTATTADTTATATATPSATATVGPTDPPTPTPTPSPSPTDTPAE